jgi:3-hydroxyacyl-CoA dehydrogenase
MKGGKYIVLLYLSYLFDLLLGPFRFMDTYGVSKIVDLMNNYRSKYGDRFAPTQLLVDMAKENKKFYS